MVYLPYLQATERTTGRVLFASIRLASMSDDTLQQVRSTVSSLAPGQSVRLERVDDRIRESLVTERALASIALTLAGCALVLSCAGVFGLMSHLVARRTREIGLRMALGARAGQVLTQVMGQAVAVAVAGTPHRPGRVVGKHSVDSRPAAFRVGDRRDDLLRCRDAHIGAVDSGRLAASPPRGFGRSRQCPEG